MRTKRQVESDKYISSRIRLILFVLFQFFRAFRREIIIPLTLLLLPSLVSAYELSAGGRHTCALGDNGVICWGSNASGQGTVPVLSNPRQISAGEFHTCALDDNGVKCWGRNASGQTSVPVLSNPTQISAGDDHVCALDESGVKCWGKNVFGQINVPVLSNPAQISAGVRHTCALDDSGVVCWGDVAGQSAMPEQVANPLQITAGYSHTCILDDIGSARGVEAICWGQNGYGQSTVPALSNPTQISAGARYTCALDDNGVVCWGWNGYGQTNVPALSNPTQITAGFGHTCALDDGGVVCWGWNSTGQTAVDNSLIFTAVNGICGESHDKFFTSIPAENLCTIGFSSDIAGTDPWTWSCAGVRGGSDASCSTVTERTGQEEGQITFIERFYQNILNRPSDPAGINFWLNIIQNESGAKVALDFFDSKEFNSLVLDNTAFINILYQTLFNRQPDQGGFDFWMAELKAGKLKDTVIQGFIRSQEFKDLASSFGVIPLNDADDALFQVQSFIERFYQLVLDRNPDVEGFNYWSAQLTNPGGSESAGDIARGFFQSDEFINRQTGDSEFTDIAYRAFFDRKADEAGKADWLNKLSNGIKRPEVINGFIASHEFINFANRYGIRAD